MLPDRVSNPGPLTYESGALPIALRGPSFKGSPVLINHLFWVFNFHKEITISCFTKGQHADTRTKNIHVH